MKLVKISMELVIEDNYDRIADYLNDKLYYPV